MAVVCPQTEDGSKGLREFRVESKVTNQKRQILLKEHSETRGNILKLVSENAGKALVYAQLYAQFKGMLSSRVSDARVVCQKRIPCAFHKYKAQVYSEETITGKGEPTVGEGKGLPILISTDIKNNGRVLLLQRD